MAKNRNYFIQLESSFTKKQDSKFHSHRLNQILLVSEGAFLFEDELSRKALYKSIGAFIPASTKHRVIAIGDKVNFKSIYFSSKDSEFKKDSIIFFKASNLFYELVNSFQLQLNKYRKELIIKLIQDILKENLSASEIYNLDLPRSRDQRVTKIIHYLDLNFYKKIMIQDIQSVLPLSERQIQRIFNEELHMSIFDYLKLKRIQSASILLHTTDKSILEITGICGYDSVSAFYENFKELLGVSPKKFKNKIIA
jgi:AraC-like DNA-binding protein